VVPASIVIREKRGTSFSLKALSNPALQRLKASFNFRSPFNLGRDATGFARGSSRPRGTLYHPGGAAFTAERQCR
jgi:hypothetical protein